LIVSRIRITAVALFVVAACSTEVVSPSTTNTEFLPTTATSTPATTSTTSPFVLGGHLIRVDPSTLENLPSLERIPIHWDSWNVVPPDGSRLITFQWDETANLSHGRAIDVEAWSITSSFDLEPHDGEFLIAEDTLYAYLQTGALVAYDLSTGVKSVLDHWEVDLWTRDGLHLLPGGRVAAVMTWSAVEARERPESALLVYDPVSGSTAEHPIGVLDRVSLITSLMGDDRWRVESYSTD
jgi:hypothetical protein